MTPQKNHRFACKGTSLAECSSGVTAKYGYQYGLAHLGEVIMESLPTLKM
jgi:hypothetical protein